MLLLDNAAGQRGTIIFEKAGNSGALPDANFAFQDRDGVMWFASFDGLHYYDGTSYGAFRHDPDDSTSLSGNRILAIYEDLQGRLWIGTSGYGLNVSDPRKKAFRRLNDQLEISGNGDRAIVTGITQSDDGIFWIFTRSGLALLQESSNGTFDTLAAGTMMGISESISRKLSNGSPFKDSHGRIWVATSGGLYRFDPGDSVWAEPGNFPTLRSSPVNDIEQDKYGVVWVCAQNGSRLYQFDERAECFKPFDGVAFKSPTSSIKFCFDADNRIWASEFGHTVYGYDLKKRSLFLDSRRNSNIRYVRFWRSPMLDDSGNIWICGDGVFKFPYPKGFHSMLHDLPFANSVSSIMLDDKYLWLGFRELGSLQYNLATHDAVMWSNDADGQRQLFSNLVYSACEVTPEIRALGQFGAIQLVNDHRVLKTFPANGTTRALYRSRDGRIWATGYIGISELDPTENALRRIDLTKSLGEGGYYLQTMVEDEGGNLWIASDDRGLFKFNPETESIDQYSPSSSSITLPSWRVTDLAILDQTLYAGTDAGLVKINLNTNSTQLYNASNGIANDFIASVIIENEESIWVATNQGISRFHSPTATFENYDSRDGLNNVFYYPRVRERAEDGTLFFGGRDGVDFFHPDDLRNNPFPPKLKITSVATSATDISYLTPEEVASGINYPYGTDFIHVRFAGLHYSSPEDVQFEYRIEGANDSWTDLGSQRDLMLTGLGAGDYNLYLRATNPDGVLSSGEIAMPIHISPPFWATTWFRVLVALLLTAGIILFVKQREARITRRQAQSAELEKQMLDLEKKALLAQMNPHFIFNAMNSIQQYIYFGDNEGAMKYLSKFSRLLRNVLQVSSRHLVSLSLEIQLITDYIELEQMRFPDKFDYSVTVSSDVDVNSVEIAPFLIQPQVENAILHGLLNKAEKGHLQVTIEHGDDRNLKVSVEDDGIGRKRAEELRLANKFQHVGRATTIVKERLMHNETINGHDPYRIIDLVTGDNEPAGTRVEMLINTH